MISSNPERERDDKERAAHPGAVPQQLRYKSSEQNAQRL